MRSSKEPSRMRRKLLYIPLLFYALFTLSPVVLMVLNSLKSEPEYMRSVFSIPSSLHFENYLIAWAGPGGTGLWRYIVNSVIVAALSLGGILILSLMGGYAFARYDFRGSDILLNYILVGLALPAHVAIIPLTIIFKNLNLLNTYWSLVITFIGIWIPLGILMMRSYFLTFPKEIEESALIDGCSPNQLFWRIVIPIAKPAITALLVLLLLYVWNDFMFCYLFITDRNLWTLPRGVFAFIGEEQNIQWVVLNSAFVISTLPTILFYAFFQRELIVGVTRGAIKG